TLLMSSVSTRPSPAFALRASARQAPSLFPSPSPSETVLQRQLNYPPIVCAGDASEVGSADLIPRLTEAGLVEQVEGLNSELQPMRPGQDHILEQGEIGAREAGAANAVAWRRSGLGSVGERAADKTAGREPLVDRVGRAVVRIADLIRPV